MSIHPASQNPFEAARLSLIAALLKLKAPRAYPNFPSPDDHEGIAKHILQGAAIFDDWLNAIGMHVADNASHNIDMRCFEGAFTGAIDGNATFEIQQCAERLTEDRDDQRPMRRRA